MGKIIELKKVNKWFDKFQVLKDIDLEVASQEKIVICGPSGSGKSTLIRCINRLEEHQKGNIVVDGTLERCALNYSLIYGSCNVSYVFTRRDFY